MRFPNFFATIFNFFMIGLQPTRRAAARKVNRQKYLLPFDFTDSQPDSAGNAPFAIKHKKSRITTALYSC